LANFAPVAALLAAYRPRVGFYNLQVREAGLNPLGWENSALIFALQLGLYLAAAAFIIAAVLAALARKAMPHVTVKAPRGESGTGWP
jgi:hypothetical protein